MKKGVCVCVPVCACVCLCVPVCACVCVCGWVRVSVTFSTHCAVKEGL